MEATAVQSTFDHDDEYEIVVVEHGSLLTTRSAAFANYVDYGEADGPFAFSYYFWIIRNSRRTIVVDTGFSLAGAEARARTVLVDPRVVLQRFEVHHDSTTPIIITHAHYDHAGNVGYFTAAPIVMARAEYDFFTSARSHHGQLRHFVDQRDVDALESIEADGRLRLVSDRLHIAPGVELIPAPGHTPGELMVLVQTNIGPVLLASDAVHFDEELERDMPFRHMCSLTDSYDTFATIRAMLASGEATEVVAGHEPSVMTRFENHPGDIEHTVTIGRLRPSAPRQPISTHNKGEGHA